MPERRTEIKIFTSIYLKHLFIALILLQNVLISQVGGINKAAAPNCLIWAF